KCEGIVQQISKRGAFGLVALIIFFIVQVISSARATPSGPNVAEMKAVISTWRNVRQIIEKGAPTRDATPVVFISRDQEKGLSKDQTQEIFSYARKADLWRGIWFVAMKNDLMLRQRATVYFMPDEVGAGIRRGKSVSFRLFDAWMR